jgi:hypothetical protein
MLTMAVSRKKKKNNPVITAMPDSVAANNATRPSHQQLPENTAATQCCHLDSVIHYWYIVTMTY